MTKVIFAFRNFANASSNLVFGLVFVKLVHPVLCEICTESLKQIMELRQVSLRTCRFSCISIIPPVLHIHLRLDVYQSGKRTDRRNL